MTHMREVEEIRFSAMGDALNALDERMGQLENFRNHGARFTAGDGKRHDRRISELERYVKEHESWGRELTGRWGNQLAQCERRVERLERWQGIKD